jgi:hypothetical protein
VEYYTRVVSPNKQFLFGRGIYYSFAQQRLAVLRARMGRVEEARRHWELFEQMFTSPDPNLVPLIDEARQALLVAETKT